MTKLNYLAVFDVFRKGEVVADPATWKNKSQIVVAVASVLVAINHFYNLGIDETTATAIGGTVAFLAGLFGTYATSDKVGLLPAKSIPDTTGQDDLRGGA